VKLGMVMLNPPYNAHNSGQPKAGPVACAGYGAYVRVYTKQKPYHEDGFSE
jgi:hypothetical protein